MKKVNILGIILLVLVFSILIIKIGIDLNLTGQVVSEKTEGVSKVYIYAGGLVASKSSDSDTYDYYVQDHLGSNRKVLADGSVEQADDFYAFGESALSSGDGENDYLYTGKELDDTGLYYYGARYYSPEIGRFIQADALAGSISDPMSLNRYAYVLNNPLKYVDPSGNRGQFIVKSEEEIEMLWGTIERAISVGRENFKLEEVRSFYGSWWDELWDEKTTIYEVTLVDKDFDPVNDYNDGQNYAVFGAFKEFIEDEEVVGIGFVERGSSFGYGNEDVYDERFSFPSGLRLWTGFIGIRNSFSARMGAKGKQIYFPMSALFAHELGHAVNYIGDRPFGEDVAIALENEARDGINSKREYYFEPNALGLFATRINGGSSPYEIPSTPARRYQKSIPVTK